uniref:Uncharacterized protein n=1 Tax=Podoviridae sp. ct8Lf7 TaxID=2827723 RepID=A0A8S5S003_9CAUD|nr:MAG TPA: hypothetical protein [Podoviridae sp. ct8Lf7]
MFLYIEYVKFNLSNIKCIPPKYISEGLSNVGSLRCFYNSNISISFLKCLSVS